MRVSVADLRSMPRELVQVVREVRAILNGGLRLGDQMQVATFKWRSTAAPVLVRYDGARPPLSVLVLRAVALQTSAQVLSGATCVWEYSRGGLLVSDIGSTTPGTEYEVTVLIAEE